MLEKLKKISWSKISVVVVFTLIFFLTENIIYQILLKFELEKLWIIIPIPLYVTMSSICKQLRKTSISSLHIAVSGFIALILSSVSIKLDVINSWVLLKLEIISFITIALFFITLILLTFESKKVESENQKPKGRLFNLIYMNTPKAHEIAMLIDNKIMKTIESEKASEELLKRNTFLNFGKKDSLRAEAGYSVEDSFKKRVYENFDVKTTKSVMFRKIYENAKNNKIDPKELKVGDLMNFESIELQQRNMDDTIMILNVLQDSKIKNQDDDLEINLNKMLDKMLDDFTIDYTFSYMNKKCIIRIPYKSIDSFENGYQHNDLQLGELSLIGIYRGEINFSKKDSISSKFLELMSQEESQSKEKAGMKLSQESSDIDNNPFNLRHNKLEGHFHLLDVIAIIQELNLNRSE